MSKYINADELLKRLPDDLPYKASVKRVLIQAPTVDVVEVVRCKDCRFLTHLDDGTPECTRVYLGIVHDNDFCSYGERREQ